MYGAFPSGDDDDFGDDERARDARLLERAHELALPTPTRRLRALVRALLDRSSRLSGAVRPPSLRSVFRFAQTARVDRTRVGERQRDGERRC